MKITDSLTWLIYRYEAICRIREKWASTCDSPQKHVQHERVIMKRKLEIIELLYHGGYYLVETTVYDMVKCEAYPLIRVFNNHNFLVYEKDIPIDWK